MRQRLLQTLAEKTPKYQRQSLLQKEEGIQKAMEDGGQRRAMDGVPRVLFVMTCGGDTAKMGESTRTSLCCVVPCLGGKVALLIDKCSNKDMDRCERKTRFVGHKQARSKI